MRSPTPLAIAAVTVLTLCVAAGVVGVVSLLNPPSPTTRITSADGSEITLDWRDFPGSSDPALDPEEVLDAPRAEDVADTVDEQIAALSTGLAPLMPGVEWTRPDPDAQILFPEEGNGYGGESLHTGYNVSTSTTGGLPADGWGAVTDALDAELSRLGYGEIVWDFEREPYPGQSRADHEKEIVRQFGSLDPEAMWMWTGMAEHGSRWVMIGVWDERRGAPGDDRPEEPSGIDLLFGGTVISEKDEAAYADGVAPFDGLARPNATTSD